MSRQRTEHLSQADILIIDDEISNLKFLLEILTKNGFRVRPASDGELALRSVRSKRPDLILLDIDMPAMDGIEVCKRLKADPTTSDIPIIFLSALRKIDIKVKALDCGGIDYVTKPINPSEVIARIETHLDVSRLHRKLVARTEALTLEIEAHRKAEESRQKLMVALENKAAEMERFVYTVSHDLKSPLITIQGFLNLLEKDALNGETERLQGDVGQIKKAARQMQELLADLLEMSRIGRLVNPPELVAFGELVQDALELLTGQINECGVRIDVAPDLPTLFGDRKRLLEVVQNLIDNALKFRREAVAPCIEIGAYREKGENICYIKDNGIGIKPRYHEKVFELFERLNPQVEGTGIGLTIVKRILELNGGRIWIESATQGKGCSFCFVLPEQGKQGKVA